MYEEPTATASVISLMLIVLFSTLFYITLHDSVSTSPVSSHQSASINPYYTDEGDQ